jgi:hypothetical protein
MRGYGGAGHLKDGADSVAPRLLVLQPALLLEEIRLRTPPSPLRRGHRRRGPCPRAAAARAPAAD